MKTAVRPGLRRHLRRSIGPASAGLLVMAVVTPAAWAAAPGNDEPAAAVAVSIGDHITLDTTEATTTPEDAVLNSNCGAPVTKASVWYSFSPAADTGVVFDMTASSYSGGFLVFEGTPTADSLITCGQGIVGFMAFAGTTYHVMAIDDDLDGDTASGGTLEFDVLQAPPPPSLDVTVDPRGRVDKAGVAHISGSYTCTDADFIELDAELRQSVGRFVIVGFGFVFEEGTCDGTAHPFSMDIASDNGKFAGGRAASIVFSFACGTFDCADGFTEQTVRLTKGR